MTTSHTATIPRLRLALLLWITGMLGVVVVSVTVLPQLLSEVTLPAPLWMISLAGLAQSATLLTVVVMLFVVGVNGARGCTPTSPRGRERRATAPCPRRTRSTSVPDRRRGSGRAIRLIPQHRSPTLLHRPEVNLLLRSCLLLLVSADSLHGQDGDRYQAPREPLYWVSDNPFRLYLVRDGDTLPDPVRSVSVFRESWGPAPEGFRVVRESTDLGFGDGESSYTMTVSPRGAVLRINGGMDYAEGEWDALLRLPREPLRVGLQWTDTLSHPTSGPAGPGIFEVRRTYRVSRSLPPGTDRRFEVEVSGELDFRLSMWTDSAAGHYRWFELRGPMEERWEFDASRGQLQRRSWSMLLEGIGGDHDGSSTDTVPAGLRSENRRYHVPEARAALLTRPLPGRDTSVTVAGEEEIVSLHTFAADARSLVEGSTRPDGTMSTAQVVLRDGDPVSWTFTWLDPASDPRERVLTVDNGFPVSQGERLTPLTPNWGVAAPGMIGTLIPSLAEVKPDQPIPFSVYRPASGTWERFTALRRRFPAFTLMALTKGGEPAETWVVDRDGVLVLHVILRTDGTPLVRVTTDSRRQAVLTAAMSALRQGAP